MKNKNSHLGLNLWQKTMFGFGWYMGGWMDEVKVLLRECLAQSRRQKKCEP
jgi:hypothetical protein